MGPALKWPDDRTTTQASIRISRLSRYRTLLDEERIQKWVDYVARGSPVTAEVYFRRLGKVCEEKEIRQSRLLGRD